MANAEKARFKVDVIRAVEEEVTAAATNSEKNVIGLAAARDIVAQLHRRFASYSQNIDSALEDGTIPASSAEAVRAVHADLSSIVESAQKELAKAVETQTAFTGGLRKAAGVVTARLRAEEQTILVAEAQEREDQRERAEWAAREAERAALVVPPVAPVEPSHAATQAAVARMETEAASALLASLPEPKPRRKRSNGAAK